MARSCSCFLLFTLIILAFADDIPLLQVHKAFIRATNEPVAIKVMTKDKLGERALQMLAAEVNILRTLGQHREFFYVMSYPVAEPTTPTHLVSQSLVLSSICAPEVCCARKECMSIPWKARVYGGSRGQT